MKNYVCDVSVSLSDTDDSTRFPKLNRSYSGKSKSVTVKANSVGEAKRILENLYGSSNIIGTPSEID
tara:strand:+ start:322 stop:522 length:201 start_codon:yes stop_codon:yes gene_type:complete